MKTEVGLTVTVDIVINDENVVLRCTENQDENGIPQPDVRGGNGWRNVLYDLKEREDVLEHLAFNAVMNRATDASELEGWADLPKGAATMHVDNVALDWITQQ